MDELAKLDNLRAENARLIALLEAHGIVWKKPDAPARVQPPSNESEPSNLSPDEKVALFMRLFRGRTDVYPMRWESKKTGKSGYSPVCLNEWRVGICDKPRVKCADCSSRLLRPLTEVIIYEHLAGNHTIGVYPLLTDDTCHFLAVDFDEADWREDARAFMQSCSELGVPAALEISRSGNGAHVWIFFARSVLARDARKLGTAIISHTCARTRQLKLASYDRLFPNQDTMPKGGFGNLIALPLQKKPCEQGFSEFVDEQFAPFADQWGYLASIRTMGREDMDAAILLATGNAHPLDVAFIAEEDQKEPWKQSLLVSKKLPGKMPKSIKVTLANMVYFEKAKLPQPLANRLIRLAAFQNPEFYKAQAMRLPVWDEPRVIGCADNYPKHIALPRGCLSAAQELLRENCIRCNLIDERVDGEHFAFQFFGTLRNDQEAAVGEMLKYDIGTLCAPTAFGKTVAAVAMIARRGVTATPIRRDGRQPIIFMQCGAIRYTAAKPEGMPQLLKVIPKMLPAPIDLPQDVAIQDVFRHLATNTQRTEFIATTISQAYQEGRKVLVLTERTDHLDSINQNLAGVVDSLFVLHGRMSKKLRTQIIQQLNELSPEAPRVLLATGKLVGEGFDHPPLDTLVLAMPISWKGTLQQYAGRLHREHATKIDVRIYDYVDTGHPVLMRMWDRRQRGYKAMGYVIGE